MRTLVQAGAQTDHIDLSLADLDGEETLELDAGPERLAVVLSGRVDAVAGEAELGVAGGRRSVFDAPGDAVYAPAGTALRLRAVDGPAQVAVTAASAPVDEALAPRVIHPADQRIAEVGEGNWSRTVRTILGPEHAAGRLLVGETINPPGNWSSYPPHRHDRHDPPREADLEEVYLFRVDPPGGFGVQIRYDDADHEEAFVVHDDDVAAIRAGFHPVVAASGYSLYYLWAMAGEGREMMPYMDPAHVWVQERA
ncbi:MAG: 5-deoxy-glucuronate isomerase [Solirubrobacterales bacterium]|nr:5-deoxy-glucuronate isomerase [Solirubrobacterales bacterium]